MHLGLLLGLMQMAATGASKVMLVARPDDCHLATVAQTLQHRLYVLLWIYATLYVSL